MKRLIDIVVSAVLLVMLLPVMLVVGVVIRQQMGSPVLFRQVRPGYLGKPFRMMKFRTMLNAQTRDGDPLPDEQRLTSFGRFLRKTSIDELPELWNVLRGHMSLVGPRPLLMEYLPLYNERQRRRHEARPGITGWAQINGRNAISWEEKFDLDVWYVDNQSVFLDLKILYLTMVRVFQRSGISAPGEATMPRFTGSAEHGE